MGNQWDADVEVTLEVAARLIERQFPDLAPVRPVLLGAGWDNLAVSVRGRYVFRFPRRRLAAALIQHELRALPLLAPRLPLPVPVPLFAGRPDEGYPYPFAGCALIPGRTACDSSITPGERDRCAVPLARFLAALHAVPVPDEVRAWAPGDELGRADLRRRAPLLKERLRAVLPGLAGLDPDRLLARADALVGMAPHPGPPCWVHGDLYARHLLLHEETLSGIIDWGDVHLGDPALDLSIAFTFLSPEARGRFREEYGTIESATWDRARFRAIHYGALLMEYGAAVGDAALRAVGEYALIRSLE